MRMLVVVPLIMALSGLCSAQQKSAEIIFINGDIYPGTISTLTKGGSRDISGAFPQPRVQALAVSSGKIVAAGTNQDVQRFKGAKTQVVDLGGHFVMPGFNDAHTHLASGGEEKMHVELMGTKSLEEMKQRLAAGVKNRAPGEWLIGRGWDETKWTEQKLPSRQDLDAVTGDHPAFCTRADGHAGVANTAAIKAAGITRDTPDPKGGKVDHDAGGEPTGYLRDTAEGLVGRKIPTPSPAQRKRAMELALADAAQHGVTSAQDNSEWADFLVMEELE